MHLKFTWPLMADLPLRESFFFGGWHPTQSLNLEWETPPASIIPVSVTGKNWFFVSNASVMHPGNPGLVHTRHDSSGKYDETVAFRGYLLEPPIHSYSDSAQILDYWLADSLPEHNGVFSTVRIRDFGNALELITDAFGLGTLYYRTIGGLVLFATSGKFLAFQGDLPDYIAWRCLIQSGFITDNRSLSLSVRRTHPGHILRFGEHRKERQQWFDYGRLSDGTRKIDDAAIDTVEDAFQTAMIRCLKLRGGEFFLALSSGYDSRRILASLVSRHVPFQSATVRIFQKEERDLDARFSSIMAKEFGFSHQIIESRNACQYAWDDYQKQILLDSECTSFHTWAVRLMSCLPEHPTFFLDGLAGDALGECGFDAIKGLHEIPESDKILIARHTITDDYDSILKPEKWPSVEDMHNEIISCIKSLPPGVNQAELAFLLFRTRRAIAPSTQFMLPAGHVPIYPYMDLDYIKCTLSYHPAEKKRIFLQEACLEKYWYYYFSYPGSRAIPPGMPPGDMALNNEKELACFQLSKRRLFRNKRGIPQLLRLLRKRAWIRLWIAYQNDAVALKSVWSLKTLMDLVSYHLEKIPCWDILDD